MNQVLIWGCWGIKVLVLVLAVASHLAYTTVGFDFEAETPEGVEVAYYRLRWDDGATWAGRAVQPVARPGRGLDWFDPGGTLLANPSRPARRSEANRWRFWWIRHAADDPYVALRYPGATSSVWVAVPSWLIVAMVWGTTIVRTGRQAWGGRQTGLAHAREVFQSRGNQADRSRGRRLRRLDRS